MTPTPNPGPHDAAALAEHIARRYLRVVERGRRRDYLAGCAITGILAAGHRQRLNPGDVKEAARLAVDLADEIAAILDETAVPPQKGGAS